MLNKQGLIALLLVIVSCSEHKSGYELPSIDLQNSHDTRDVYLSDMISDIHIIRLETLDEILLGQNTIYLVGAKYIITIDNEKILQFSAAGAFIRTLTKAGKGPDEFMRADAFAMDEKNDIFYLNHRGDYHNISVHNLITGERIRRIPTGVENIISKLILLNDSVLVVVPRMNNEFNLYYLSVSGKILGGIAPPEVKGIGLETTIEKVGKDLYYMPKEYDTLYKVREKTCDPYYFFSVDDRFTIENNEIGNFVFISANGPGFIIANKAHARIILNDDGETFSMNADKITRYFINKNDFSVSEIKDFYNDFLGIEEELNPWNNYLSLNNSLGFVTYSAFELKQKIEKSLESKDITNELRERISLLNEEIRENDNPVLLVGKLK